MAMGEEQDEFTLVLEESFRKIESVQIASYIRRSEDLLDALDGLERELDALLDEESGAQIKRPG